MASWMVHLRVAAAAKRCLSLQRKGRTKYLQNNHPCNIVCIQTNIQE